MDYLVLVNRDNRLPAGWENELSSRTVWCENTVQPQRKFILEENTLAQFERLRKALLEEGIQIEIDSAVRTIAEQQAITEEFTEKYGPEYAEAVVAKPGHSEHHTGLALDILLVISGRIVDENEDMLKEVAINRRIVEKLPDYGFILRYPKGKEAVTGYEYEPWHYRFVGDSRVAHEIMDNHLTLEEYLAGKI